MITVKIEDREVQVMLQEAPQRVRRAVIRAMNRAIGSARTVMVREIAQDTGLTSTVVRKAMPIRRATLGIPAASIAASLSRIPLIRFKARGREPSRGRGKGVSWNLPSSAGNDPNAFIANVYYGKPDPLTGEETVHRGVFKRKGPSVRKSQGAWSMNLPIIQLYGPSLGHVFIKYQPLGEAKAQEAFLTNFEHELVFAGTEPAAPTDAAIEASV